MSINADNIIGTYDIYTKQYIVTFTEKPTLIESTDCSFQISIIPEFECAYSGLSIPDGIVGDTVTPTVTEGTIGTITPSTYQQGSATYSVQITAPGGYTNAGNIILCDDTATGTPTFVCGDAGLSVNDGNVGDAVTGTVVLGTIVSFTPSTYVSGSSSYTATITVPSGYSNTGGTIDCPGSATGIIPAYAQITGPTSQTIFNSVSLTANSVGFTGTSWAWTGYNATGKTTETIVVTETSPGSKQYGVTINGTYQDAHTVTWNNPAPFTSISGPTTATPNTNITLTASDNYYTAVSWVWAGGVINNSVVNPVTFTETSSGVVTYYATGTDSSNNTYQASHTVDWSAAPAFTCGDLNFAISDGTTGAAIDLNNDITVDEGTVTAVTPSTYQSGSSTYYPTVTIPPTYAGAGSSVTFDGTSGNLNCGDTATGTAATPTYSCSNTTYTQANGTTGNATAPGATFSDSNITTYSISPSTYTSGSATYTATITVPAGYTNSGQSLTLTACPATATGVDPSLYYTFNACSSGGAAVYVLLSSQPSTGARYINSSTQEYYTFSGNAGSASAAGTVVTLNDTGLQNCPP
jgi:hypothetical protein